MKKGFILFTALFLLSTFTAFAAVSAKKEGDVVKVTWTYENADAASVGLTGDFQGWNLAGAFPMTKDANGVWTYTMEGKADSEFKYKFNVDGEWTEDPTAVATVDDGFGGNNGLAVVADLLAAAASGTGVVSTSKGLIVGLYEAVWVNAAGITENPAKVTQDGFAFNDLSLNHKAYLKFDGPLYPGLVTVTGEIKVFDGAVQLYKKNDVNNASGDVTWAQGGEALAVLPWTTFNSFGAKWPDLKGKLRTTVTLADLDMKISHSVGWSKSAKQDIGGLYITAIKDPDANAGITEVYSDKALNLGFGKLDYIVNFNAQDSTTLKNLVFGNLAGDNYSVELLSNIAYGTTDIGYLSKKMTSRDMLGGTYKLGDLSLKAQGGIWTDATEGVKLVDPYFGAATLGYNLKDLLNTEVTFKYAGTDAHTGYMNDDDDKFDGNFENNVKLTYTATSTISATVENHFTATYDEFKTPADDVTASVTYKDGITVTPEVKVLLPIDGSKFAVDYASLNVVAGGLAGLVRLDPNEDFSVNDLRIRSTYDISTESQVQFAARFLLDSDDATNAVGITLGYSLKTPFEAVKSPYFFTNVNYNLDALVAADDSALEDIDDADFTRTNKGAALRAGLRWNF